MDAVERSGCQKKKPKNMSLKQKPCSTKSEPQSKSFKQLLDDCAMHPLFYQQRQVSSLQLTMPSSREKMAAKDHILAWEKTQRSERHCWTSQSSSNYYHADQHMSGKLCRKCQNLLDIMMQLQKEGEACGFHSNNRCSHCCGG